jgi:hypothetical protein
VRGPRPRPKTIDRSWWHRLRYALLLIGLCAIATCPAAKRACTTGQRDAEADALLGYLVGRVAAHAAATGRVPPSPAGPTPARGCCDQDGPGGQTGETGECAPDAATWTAAGWRELAFSIDGPYRYAYQYVPDPGGRSAVLRAVGDVDCDGAASTLEVKLTVVGRAVMQAWSRKPPRS